MYLAMGAQTGHIMTLANSIIGVGILAMPFCFQKCGILLSILLLLMSNILTRISCHYLIKSSLLTRRKTFEFLAFHAFGFSGKLMVELCIIGYLMGTCIAYYVVVGDLGPQIISKLFSLNNNETLRTWVMIVVTIICVVPLGFLKNVDSLSAVCTASIGFYFCLVLKVIAESKTHLALGDWYDRVEYWKPAGILQCLPIFSMALSCQMQIFEVYETMTNPSLERMNSAVKSAINICTSVYIFVGIFGYIAFCNQEFSGNILLNFSQSLTSDAIKIGFVLSVAFSFPLVIFPCRASLYSLLYRRNHSDAANYIPETKFKWLTVVIVLITLMVGLLIPSIELVIGLVGSTIGVAICIMFPSSCFYKVSKKESNEKLLAQFILFFGFSLMILGTYANLNAIDEKNSGPVIEFKNNNNDIKEKAIEIANEINSLKVGKVPTIEPYKIESIGKVVDPPDKNVPARKETADEIKILESAKNDKTELKLKPETKENQHKSKDFEKFSIKDEKLNADKKEDIDPNAIQKEEQEIAIDKIEKIEKFEETKKLLAEQVKEIKEEFVKQSKDTQKLVEDKLNEISKKVEDIEKSHKDDNNEVVNHKHDSPLIELLSDNKINGNHEYKIESEIREESNKNENLIKDSTKVLTDDQIRTTMTKLIPPIPLLKFNSSSLTAGIVEIPGNLKVKEKPEENKLLKENLKPYESSKDKAKDDVESIRRELLDLSDKRNDDDITTVKDEKRDKREIEDIKNCDKNKVNEQNIELKIINYDNELLDKLGKDIFDMEPSVKLVGRDLKSIDENDKT